MAREELAFHVLTTYQYQTNEREAKPDATSVAAVSCIARMNLACLKSRISDSFMCMYVSSLTQSVARACAARASTLVKAIRAADSPVA